jgi:hypothetical protein
MPCENVETGWSKSFPRPVRSAHGLHSAPRLGAREPGEDAEEPRVLAAREHGHQAGVDREERRDAAPDVEAAAVGGEHPGDRPQERGLAGAARGELERDVAQSPALAALPAKARQRARHDPALAVEQEPDAEPVGGDARFHQTTFAN